jgi:HEAT repeat protein
VTASGPPHDTPAPAAEWSADPIERAAAVAALGLRRLSDPETGTVLARLAAEDPDPRVRSAALGALARLPQRPVAVWLGAASDGDPSVRRRAADLAPAFASATPGPEAIAAQLVTLLADDDAAVCETAAWALGELGAEVAAGGAIGRLAEVARSHGDPLVREAAVAALGALGDPAGLEAVLEACGDKPAIRRRAVLALAAFEGPEVDAALRTALEDKDWQTRQAAEDLLG